MAVTVSDLGDYSKVFAASPEGIETVGGLWYAPFGSELPDDVDADLDELKGPDGTSTDVYINLGYISVDGSTLKIDGKTKPIEIWSGREIGSMRDGFPVSLSMKLLQVLDPAVNAVIFGEDAVSTSKATKDQGARMKVEISSKLPDRVTLVLDSFFEAKSMRQVFEIAQVDELGDIKEVHNDVMAYEPTFKVFPGSTGKNVIRFSDDGVVDPDATS
jgi:hypothetical protein